jgi:hypothetical protein
MKMKGASTNDVNNTGPALGGRARQARTGQAGGLSSGRRSADSPAALRRVCVVVKEGAIVHREGR